jgi:hypothetical protein
MYDWNWRLECDVMEGWPGLDNDVEQATSAMSAGLI